MSEKSEIESALTPTEELIIDVLTARHRLGEPFWPIALRNSKAINSLEEKGLVTDYGSATEGCVRVALTLKAKTMWAQPERYVPPIFRDRPDDLKKWRKLQYLLFAD